VIPWGAPSVAGLELTLRCPCRCQTCGSRAGAARPRELEHDEWLGVIDGLARLGCRHVSLLGGEPLLYSRWAELAEAARLRELVVDLVSSGQGIDQDVASRIRDSGLHAVTISVDALADTHDRQRGVAGCFAQALRAIRLLDRAGLMVGVTSQLNQESFTELEALAPVLEDAGVLGWQLQLTLPMGRTELHRHLPLPPDMMPALLRVLRRLAARPGLRPHLTDNLGYCTSDDLELRTVQGGFPRPWLGCRAGLEAVGITSDGNVKGCLALPDACIEGNVRAAPLAELWNDPRRFSHNRRFTPAQLGGECQRCEHSAGCRGGCTAAAYARFGRPGISDHCFRLHDRPGR